MKISQIIRGVLSVNKQSHENYLSVLPLPINEEAGQLLFQVYKASGVEWWAELKEIYNFATLVLKALIVKFENAIVIEPFQNCVKNAHQTLFFL